ncbi:TetR/AcrR family transcriptional regulator [Terrabacter terrigena]|uniref:TetR/AcrR family transcriptional regulator n=1 Tax=Terrabacter terrigena TaxID=574718 RepID=A0ABW3MVB0_9MICO
MSTEPSVERTLFDLHARPERRDAARNRELLLDAAHRLVDRDGVESVTMDAVAAEAGVGKGTVFRRFGSRAGLMTALLDHTEARWQGQVISGPPPLGPGAPPLERLLAFGASRLDRTVASADLMVAAAGHHGRSGPAVAFWTVHVRHLLTELGVTGDLPLLAMALLAPLDVSIVRQQLDSGVGRERILAAWADLVERVVAGC